MFYHSSKNTNSVNQSIEVFSFVLDLQQMGGGTACARQTPPTPHQASSLQLDSEKWGHEGRGHSQRDGTPSSTPLSPGSLPLHTTLFLTFSLRLEQTVLSLSSTRLTHLPSGIRATDTLHVPPDHLPLSLRPPPPTPNRKHFTTGLACLPRFGVCIPTHCFAPWICYSVNSFPRLFQPCVFSPGLGCKMH